LAWPSRALDDVQRHALAGELDTVRVAESSIPRVSSGRPG
jgi:hypothetical protein